LALRLAQACPTSFSSGARVRRARNAATQSVQKLCASYAARQQPCYGLAMSVMNSYETRPRARWCAVALLFVAPLAVGCASRTAPFNELNDAQVTILRLQAQQAQQQTTTPGATPLIPGLPAEWQTMANQVVQQWQQTLPGLLPPGLIPGQPATPTPQPAARLYKNQWMITAEQPVLDQTTKDELLDLFGNADSFQTGNNTCFYPGMAVIFAAPKRVEPVEVMVSFSCNRSAGYGFQWPYPSDSFKAEAASKLAGIYQRMWGPIPPGA
jgi:hypothetical protein